MSRFVWRMGLGQQLGLRPQGGLGGMRLRSQGGCACAPRIDGIGVGLGMASGVMIVTMCQCVDAWVGGQVGGWAGQWLVG